ncbi:hypothetical protein [Microbacterium aurugineum]
MYSSSMVVRDEERRDGAVLDMLERSRDDGSCGVLVVDLGGGRWRIGLSGEVQAGRVCSIVEGEAVPAASAEPSLAAVEDA